MQMPIKMSMNSIVIFAQLKSHSLWLLSWNRSDWGLTEFELNAYARTKPSAKIISSHTGFRFCWLFLEHSRSKHNRILRHRIVPKYMRPKYTHSVPIINRLYSIEMENLHTQYIASRSQFTDWRQIFQYIIPTHTKNAIIQK